MTANTLPTRSYVLDDVIACLRSLAVGRIAPSSRTYDEKRSPGLPNARLLWLHGHKYSHLVALAGLEPALRGNAARQRHAGRQVDFATVDAEVRQRMASAEPPRPATWPLFGIPTRTEQYIGTRRDGARVRVTRQYFSLR